MLKLFLKSQLGEGTWGTREEWIQRCVSLAEREAARHSRERGRGLRGGHSEAHLCAVRRVSLHSDLQRHEHHGSTSNMGISATNKRNARSSMSRKEVLLLLIRLQPHEAR